MTTVSVDRPESGATHPAEDVTIRRATPADAETVHVLVLEIAAHEDDLEHVHLTPDRWVEQLQRSDVVVLLTERAGLAIGYTCAGGRLHLWTGGDLLAIDGVYVRPGEPGVGRRLLTAMAAFADPDALTITWGAEPEHARAQWFYERLSATLRNKVVAGWTPPAYRQIIASDAGADR